jgi:hypothetical protein
MGLYDTHIATAKRMIAKYGQSCQWVIPAATTQDSAKPWKTSAGVPTSKPVKIAFFPMGTAPLGYASRGKNVDGPQQDAPEVVGGEMIGYMAPSDFFPNLSDHVTRVFQGQTETLRVLAIDVIAPAGDPVLYTVTFAK